MLIAASTTAALRGVLLVLGSFVVWPAGGVATFALAHIGGWAPLGVAAELMLVIAAIVGTAKIVSGLRTQQRRWYSRAEVLGWAIIGNTVFYFGSMIVGLWAVDGPSLVVENLSYLAVFLVLHLPQLWLSVRTIRKARRLMGSYRAAGTAQRQ